MWYLATVTYRYVALCARLGSDEHFRYRGEWLTVFALPCACVKLKETLHMRGGVCRTRWLKDQRLCGVHQAEWEQMREMTFV